MYHQAYDELERRLVEAGIDVPLFSAEIDELTALLRAMNETQRERGSRP